MRPSTSFAFMQSVQGEAPWGRVLDAGTGPRSLPWLLRLETDSLTAVTGSPGMAAQVQPLLDASGRPQDRLLVGNWSDPEFLAGERFDTVVADNLLGAIEGFAPFFQTALFRRLRALTEKRLYLAGMEPYVIDRPQEAGGALIWEIGRFRDACLMLAGQRQYREYPLRWVIEQLRRARFKPLGARKIPTGYKADFVTSQVGRCRPLLQRLPDRTLAGALLAHGGALQARALAHIEAEGALNHAYHYVVAADPV